MKKSKWSEKSSELRWREQSKIEWTIRRQKFDWEITMRKTSRLKRIMPVEWFVDNDSLRWVLCCKGNRNERMSDKSNVTRNFCLRSISFNHSFLHNSQVHNAFTVVKSVGDSTVYTCVNMKNTAGSAQFNFARNFQLFSRKHWPVTDSLPFFCSHIVRPTFSLSLSLSAGINQLDEVKCMSIRLEDAQKKNMPASNGVRSNAHDISTLRRWNEKIDADILHDILTKCLGS